MKIGIITAMPEETRAIVKNTIPEKNGYGRRRFNFQSGSQDIILIEAGMGMINAGLAAKVLAAEGVNLLISAGFGGGVLPGLDVADVVVAQQVWYWTGSGLEAVGTSLHGIMEDTTMLGLKGVFITTDAILNKQELGGLLPSHTERPVVEMESAAVARVATDQGIPFLGIRAISDPWDEELGFSIHEFCDDQMRIRPLKVLATIMRRPSIIPQLIRLARNSHKAANSLEKTMEQLLQQL